MKKTKYFPFITGIKGYAALAIFGRHVLPFHAWGNFGDSIVGSLAHFVTAFFFLSGFTLASSILNKKTFHYAGYLLDRLFRIAPLYWIVCIVAFFFSDIAFGLHYQAQAGIGRFDINNLLHHLLFTNGIFVRYQNSLIGVEWTIPIEVLYYFLIPAFVFIAARSLNGMFVLIFSGILLKYLYLQINLPIYIGNVFHDLWRVERYLIVFSLGILWYTLFFRAHNHKKEILSFGSYVLSIVIGVISYIFVLRGSYSAEKAILYAIVGLICYSSFVKPFIYARIRFHHLAFFIQNIDIFLVIPLFVYYLVSPKNSFEIIISLFTGELLLACRNQGPAAKIIFQNKFIIFIGTISYSIYLLHVPVIKAVALISQGFMYLIVSIIAVTAISWISFMIIETPGKNLGRRVRQLLLQ